jgi:putative tryptophan/tyrosine transport system substrate-binding protein
MAIHIRRREFLFTLGSAAAWPLAARAQQPAMPVLGFLNSRGPNDSAQNLASFHRGLKQAGFVEGHNVKIEYRWAQGQFDQLPALAAELVRLQVNVISATGGTASCLAAKQATTTIPVVFLTGSDPVQFGLVTNLNRPGGNLTGVSFLVNMLTAKQFELLHELVPNAQLIGFLVNPINPNTVSDTRNARAAADSLGLQLQVLNASSERDIDTAFAALVKQRAIALLVSTDPYFSMRTNQIVALAIRHAVPTMYSFRQYVTAGGLMSYAPSVTDAFAQVGVYAGRILKGEKPGDLPVMQSTKFELVINLTTAKVLGLEVPPALLALADEVIE